MSVKRLIRPDSALLIAAIFLLSRAVYFLAGVRFNFSPLDDHWQFLDPVLLHDQLAESIFYLHIQPPLLNLICALAGKVSADRGQCLLNVLFLLLGLSNALCMRTLMVRLGASVKVALAVTVLFILNPVSVLYENYLFYTHIVMTLLCVSSLLLERYFATRRTPWIACFFVSAACVVLIRSSFHIAWLALVAAVVTTFAPPGDRKKVLAAAAIPLALALGWYLKTRCLFGTFGSSTWMGMSLVNSWRSTCTQDELDALYQARVISKLTRDVQPMSQLKDYAPYVRLPPPTGHEVLDQPCRSGGRANFNHIGYVGVSNQYLADSRNLLKARPRIILRNQQYSWPRYFRPSSQYHLLGQSNLSKVRWWDRFYRIVYYWQIEDQPDDSAAAPGILAFAVQQLRDMSLSTLIGTAVIVFYVPWRARRLWKEGRKPVALTLLFSWFNIIYVACICNLLEMGENHRFRFETEGLWTILMAVILTDVIAAVRRRRQRVH